MKITEARDKYLFTTRIELPHEEGEDVDFVLLREFTVEEIQLFGNDDKSNIDILKKLFLKCLIKHSFVNDDMTQTENQKVCDVLKESGSLYTEIIETWYKSIPFRSRLVKQPK